MEEDDCYRTVAALNQYSGVWGEPIRDSITGLHQRVSHLEAALIPLMKAILAEQEAISLHAPKTFEAAAAVIISGLDDK